MLLSCLSYDECNARDGDGEASSTEGIGYGEEGTSSWYSAGGPGYDIVSQLQHEMTPVDEGNFLEFAFGCLRVITQ